MTETDLRKIPFFKLLNLEAITPKNDSSKIFKNHLLVERHHKADLKYKNNSIKTGYENFCIEKGTLKLFPFKDFDFIGKHVVCQKCCQKFASKLSYKAHAGTNICVKTYNGPNLIYLKYKNRNHRQGWKKKKKTPEKDICDIKKILLEPEILNTLQTRNKVYSDNIIQQQNKVKEKPMNNSDKNNEEKTVKKPRGRPKKDTISNNFNVNLKKRGRPKKLNAVTVDSSNQNDNISSSNMEIEESEEPKMISNFSFQYAFNKNINDDGQFQSLTSTMKYLLQKFRKVFAKEGKPKFVNINKHQYPTKHQTQYNEGKKDDLSAEANQILLKIEELKNDFKFIVEQFKGKKEYPFNSDLKVILKKICEKRDEIKQSLLKKTNMKTLILDEGKENIKSTLKKNENETEIEMNNIDFDENEKCIGIWTNNSNTVSSSVTMKINDGCKSTKRINKDNFKKEPTSQNNFEDNLKTLTVKTTPNTNSVKNHLNDLGLNYNNNSTLNCGKCKKKFKSIAEWKLHCSEHLVKINKSFLCSVCGLRFKVFKNFKQHIRTHKQTEKRMGSVKTIVCKVCEKEYNYLNLYFAHVKTHNNE